MMQGRKETDLSRGRGAGMHTALCLTHELSIKHQGRVKRDAALAERHKLHVHRVFESNTHHSLGSIHPADSPALCAYALLHDMFIKNAGVREACQTAALGDGE